MSFDRCAHDIKNILIQCGIALREAKGLPEEKNITILYEEALIALNIPYIDTHTGMADHLPSPAEMKDENGKFIIPRRDCPQCGQKESVSLTSICLSCQDAEGGKYKTAWICNVCNFKEKSEKFLTQWLKEFNIVNPNGFKRDLGIKTLTDQGLK